MKPFKQTLLFFVFLFFVLFLFLVGCIHPTRQPYRIIFCGNTNCPICAGYFDKEKSK